MEQKLTPGRKLILDLLSKSVAKIKAADCANKAKENDVKIVSRKKIKTEKDMKENIVEHHDDVKVENEIKIKEEYVEHKLITEEKKEKKKKRVNKNKDDEKVCIDQQNYLDDEKGSINVKSEHIAKVPDMNDKKLDEQKLKKQDSKAKVLNQKVQSNNLLGFDKEDKNKNPKHKIHRRKAGTSLKKFSPEEKQIILDAIEKFGDKINLAQLGQDLQRTESSMRHAVRRLKAGSKKKRTAQKFTLSEDLMILDAVLKNLGKESLETLDLHQNDWREFGPQLGRGDDIPRSRWKRNLQPWILQHYSGTLNLELRRPLANYLAENFSDINSVDWHSVIKEPEFAGHTSVSLRSYFSIIFKHAKHSLKRVGENISLEMVAEFANSKYATGERKVLDRDLKRQQEIIDYFKCYVKTNCITNFL